MATRVAAPAGAADASPTRASATLPAMPRLNTLIMIVYLIVGVVIASDRNYLNDLDRVKRIVSAALAIVLWPLVLLGVDFRID